MEGVKAALLAMVDGQRFAAVEEGARHSGLVDSHLGVPNQHLGFTASFSHTA